MQFDALRAFIQEQESQSPSPRLNLEAIPHTAAKNAYYARYRLQQCFQSETFQLQIDSHMRLVPQWDTKMIEMLC